MIIVQLILQDLKELLLVYLLATFAPKQLFAFSLVVSIHVIVGDVQAADRHRLLAIVLRAFEHWRLEEFIWEARNAQPLILLTLQIGINEV